MEDLVRDEGSTIETDLCGNILLEDLPLSGAGPAVPPGRPHCNLASSPVLVNRLLRSDPGRMGKALALKLPPS
ncbi:hypothetical protein N7447_011104 [Penicillium robsamsonii]|uniref:uncharacterized protein n=1 Tax=Penicillium robsamsonii TaxID=1792511 RepID=UPI0025477D1C|nr:uncharacterized protein N7447_011104 [Penicillium robsamsonii]KAJ5807648.1 hypothetical protein N7447_011104 [Penicillium robsamsonii]